MGIFKILNTGTEVAHHLGFPGKQQLIILLFLSDESAISVPHI